MKVTDSTYQQSRFLDLMQGYSRSVDLYNTALNSTGATQQKFNEWQQGTEAQIAKLQNTIQGFWMSAINSNEIQTFLSGLNTIASGFKTLTENIGILPTALGLVTEGLLLFNKNVRTTFTEFVTSVKTAYLEFGVFSKSLATGEEIMIATSTNATMLDKLLVNLSVTARGVGAAADFLGSKLKSAFLFLGETALPVAAIMAVGYAIEKVTEAISKQQQEEEQLKAQQDNLISSYANHKDQISKLVQQYDDLTKVKENSGGNLNLDNEKQYVDIQNQLAQLLPTVKIGIDEKGNAIVKTSDAIKEQIQLLQQQIDLETKQKSLDAPQNIKNNTDAVNTKNVWSFLGFSNSDSLEQQMKTSKEISDGYKDDLKNAKDEKLTKAEIVEINRELNAELIKQAQIQGEITTKQQQNATEIQNYFKGSKIDTTSLQQVSSLLSSSLDFKGMDVGQIDGTLSVVTKAINDLYAALSKNDQNGIDKAEQSLQQMGIKGDALQKILTVLTDAQNQGSKAAKGMSDALGNEGKTADQIAKDLQNAKGDFSALSDVVKEMAQSGQIDQAITTAQGEAYSTLAKQISPINQLLEEMAQGKKISADEAMNLIGNEADLANAISIENGQVKINQQAVIDLRDAKVASYQDMVNSVKLEVQAQADGLKEKLKNYGIEIQAIQSVADANQALAEAEKKKNDQMNSINNSNSPGAMYASTVVQKQYDDLSSGINQIKDAYNQIDQLSNMASTGLTQVGTSVDKAGTSTQNTTYVTDKYKQSLDALDASLTKLQNLQKNYAQDSQQYRDALNQEIGLLQQKQQLMEAQAKSLQDQIASGNIIQTGMITSSNSVSGSSSYSPPPLKISGGSASEQIWNALKSAGLSDGAVAGVMGNLMQESSLATDALNPNGAYGLAQWMGGRLSGLQNYASQQGKDSNDLSAQIGYLITELNSGQYGSVSAMNNMSATDAAAYFEKMFEKSGGDAVANRQNYANQYYSQFKGSGSNNGGDSSGSTTTSNDPGKAAAQQAQAIDQAKSNLLSLQDSISQVQDQIQGMYLEIVNSNVAAIDKTKNQIEGQITQYDYLQNVYDKSSKQWMDIQVKREQAYQSEMGVEQKSIDYINQQIQYNNKLNDAQRSTLSDEVLQRQSQMVALEQKLYDTRNQMATQIIDTYKQALTSMKDAATKSIDNMINDINNQANQADYKKKLSDAQKSAQDIQDQINKLMLDDSASAKKQVADLQKQLATQNDSITQMVSDNDKQTRLDNLNNQKQAISDYYDNMLNDEQKFSNMRTQILNLSNQGIINELNKFSTTIQHNVGLLGTSVVNNLITLINQANSYMGSSKQLPLLTASFDTGGMTPGWGSGGKMAMLHEKELILNKFDTSNLLKVIDITRNLVSNFKIPNFNNIPQMATAGGNTYEINLNIDKVTGDQNGAKTLLSAFVDGVKRLGGKIN